MFLTQGACFSTERREYFNSSLSAKRLAEISASSFLSSSVPCMAKNEAQIKKAGATFRDFPLKVKLNFNAEAADDLSEKYATIISLSA